MLMTLFTAVFAGEGVKGFQVPSPVAVSQSGIQL